MTVSIWDLLFLLSCMALGAIVGRYSTNHETDEGLDIEEGWED